MPFISITRLRVRSVRFLPFFLLYTYRSLGQVKKSSGFQGGGLLADRSWTFWTMTAWDNQESMRRFMTSGSHKAAMPKLLDWCDEASVVHWERPEAAAAVLDRGRSTNAPGWACVKGKESRVLSMPH